MELKIESPKKIGSKLVVFDVGNKTTNELYERNLKRAGVSENKFRQGARIVLRTNHKGVDVGNVVVKLTRRTHDILMS